MIRTDAYHTQMASDSRKLAAARNLASVMARRPPGGLAALTPLPHDLSQKERKSNCHRDRILSFAKRLEESSDYRPYFRERDPLIDLITQGEPLCEVASWQKADALLVGNLSGFESVTAQNTANTAVAIGITAATMGTVIAVPNIEEGLVLEIALVDNQGPGLLAVSRIKSSKSASEEDLEKMLPRVLACFDRLAGQPAEKLESLSTSQCHGIRPFRYWNQQPGTGTPIPPPADNPQD
ncbi:MAG: hypothetical protein AB1405_18445 [Bdellovibrionota bacterium]